MFARRRRLGIGVLRPFFDGVIVPVQLSEVMVLEVVVERLEEQIERSHRLVGQLGEGEEISLVD